MLLLWTGVKRTAAESTRRYRIATVAGGVIARVVVCLVPYAPLLNVLSGPNGLRFRSGGVHGGA